ncbi:NAD(P)H-nitrite reductase [Halodesulfurarchaeum formicicum]|uniref:NAD(P)H-nitrite reductase n=1 Tax=Halodesulfurarchaeum formicicum TaxID=1873524 RepID=A0A1D8S2B5_9EURY|nr:FAD-dependent oxidoreductase [Halodesulfurarchaeum formicicum]AOW79504.1 NAD(P)H-nitrite reductase [Halodesulfurarchaeum formicicum]APE94756.1 NAD(P)H-nitrite reductase [Halodesulfurarchaeum formicicum]
MSASYVIIGDGIAGSTAAETLREHDDEADITVITDEGEALYNRILIKEFAKGKMPEGPVSIHDGDWYSERDIDLQLNTHVTQVDDEAHEVHTHTGDTIEYDKLLVATGGTPTQLPVPGSDAEGVHHFWTFEDARGIREGMEAADDAVIVGAGLLGIDLAAIAGAHDVENARYIMRGNRWWRYALSLEGAEIMHDAMRDLGVELVLESGVEEFVTDEDGHVEATIDANGDRYESDFVGAAIGLNFNTELLQGTAVEADSDGIHTDSYMRTDAEDVYAAGDIVVFEDPIVGREAQNGSWGSAKEQGDLAARTMLADAGEDVETEAFRWVSSYSITHFDFPFLSFGYPTEGDDEAERKYDETTWRRLAFEDGQLIGGVLIGDMAAQSKFKAIIKSGAEVADQKDVLLQENFDVEDLDVDVEIDA